jgi:peptidoglycan/LPS O-acetylase OafA/YrhL
MRATHLPDVPSPQAEVPPGIAVPSGGYLHSLDLFRVVACAAVVGNHSFIWANMSANVVGTGFITLLHLSRNAFFFLSGLVICYSQINHPRSWPGFWKRRYVQLGVPYLAWTCIYLVFALATISLSWSEAGSFLRQNLLMGYSQLYPAFVIFQYLLVFPLLLKLLRSTRQHGLIMGASLAFALVLGLTLHYPAWIPALTDVWRACEALVPWSRDLLTYQEFFVAGALVALHFDDVCRLVSRHYRPIFLVSSGVGALLVLWYVVQVDTGSSLLQASDPYQAEAVIWYFAAIAAIFSFCVWHASRAESSPGAPIRRSWTTSTGLAALTGGVWLSHNLFLTSLRDVLGATGLRDSLPWEATVAILFVGTVALSGTFVAVVLRTRLRWVLGGPVRAEQRAGYAQSPPTSISRASIRSGSGTDQGMPN